VGQYSVGKTSFIRYLLGRDFPGQRIGPEPTTDRFTVLLNGPEERTIPGNALSVHPELPFRGLEKFGVNFLSRLEGSQLPSSVLRSIALIGKQESCHNQRFNSIFTHRHAWNSKR
jgi:GTPase SAR1 family protein